jgi:hypothetical protein
MLEQYLRQVENREFAVDVTKSDLGTLYVFRAEEGLSSIAEFNDAFSRFDEFMKLCGSSPAQALAILHNHGLTENAEYIVNKYDRDYRRMLLDSKHELERRKLALKQRMETEIDEVKTPLIESSIVHSPVHAAGLNFNINNLSLVNVHSIEQALGPLISTTIEYNQNDKMLLELFKRYADSIESLQCKSDLDQLKDGSIPEQSRQNAKQRLVGFLRKAASKAGKVAEKVAVETLTKYLQSLAAGTPH